MNSFAKKSDRVVAGGWWLEPCRNTNALGPTGQRFCLQPQPQATQIVYQQKWLARWAEKFSALAYDDPGRCPGLGEPRAFGPASVSRKAGILPTQSDTQFRVSFLRAGTCLLLPSPNESLSPDREHAYPQFRRVKAHHPAACLAAAFVAWLAVSTAALADGPIVLRDVTKQTGIDFRHTDGSSGRRYFIEYIASGLATFDYDNDGRIDIYFLNGRALPGAKADVPAKNHLYRNLGGFRFEDVTEKAGVGDAGYGLGVCVGDYDNDGHADIYVSNFGPNVLYHNNGDGTFTDVTARAGVGRGEKKVGAGASFLDIDGDGNLDLFAANYVRFSFEANKPHYLMGTPTYPNPLDFPHDTNNLFHNNGDGTFADVSERSGIAAHPAPGWESSVPISTTAAAPTSSSPTTRWAISFSATTAMATSRKPPWLRASRSTRAGFPTETWRPIAPICTMTDDSICS